MLRVCINMCRYRACTHTQINVHMLYLTMTMKCVE